MPSISLVTTSPGWRKRGGLRVAPMPAGVPVGTLAIGAAGAANAGLLAAQILALSDDDLAGRIEALRTRQTAAVPEAPHDDD